LRAIKVQNVFAIAKTGEVVLDPKATPFTRAWCAFEEATAVDETAFPGKPRLLLDIATYHDGSAKVLTDGSLGLLR